MDRAAEEGLSSVLRGLRATYRLQLHSGFGFAAARVLVPYLAELGVSHVYASPIFAARAGSPHGYDVVDPTRLNPELGSPGEFDALLQALERHGLGLLLDIVPNHMAATWENPWWRDVLEWGRRSPYAAYFDIWWDRTDGVLLFPVLGDRLERVIASGELRVALEPYPEELRSKAAGESAPDRTAHAAAVDGAPGAADGAPDGAAHRVGDAGTPQPVALLLRYHEHRFPLHPATWAPILEEALQPSEQPADTPVPDRPRRRLACILTAVEGLTAPAVWRSDGQGVGDQPAEEAGGRAVGDTARNRATDPRGDAVADRADRALDTERGAATAARRDLGEVLAEEPLTRPLVEAAVEAWNRRPERLEALVAEQAYRPEHYLRAGERPGYRRFFDIGHLVGVRVEDPAVFAHTHRLILELAARRPIEGLRVDHIDGLRRPQEYLERLAAALARQRPEGGFLLVEKILAPHETLPDQWPVSGTTGYELLNALNHAFVDPAGFRRLRRFYRRFTGDSRTFADVVYQAKRQVLDQLFGGEVEAVVDGVLERGLVPRRGPAASGLEPSNLRRSLVELTACLDVYRTYVGETGQTSGPVAESDRARIHDAVNEAQRRNAGRLASAFAYWRRLLTLSLPGMEPAARGAALEVVAVWQQLSGPAMAKGLEDTSFYRYVPLLSLNEVGGEVGLAEDPAAYVHARLRDCRLSRPGSLFPGSTHDTKRAEDVRARIDVLSSGAEEWTAALEEWDERARPLERVVGERTAPGPAERLLLFQTLVGAWPVAAGTGVPPPAFADRIAAYLVKSLREAKVNSSWLDPDEAYEEAVVTYARALLAAEVAGLPDDIGAWAATVAPYGALVSLAQLAIRLTGPAVPDFYQGGELWDLSLVDPDNRRPVDFTARADALSEVPDRGRLPLAWRDGRIKLALIQRLLALRTLDPELFRQGDYRPLPLEGPRADELLAFIRGHDGRLVCVLVPRYPGGPGYRVGSGSGDESGEPTDCLPEALPEYWRGTTVRLPGEGNARGWRHVLADATAGTGDVADTDVANLLVQWPLCVLRSTDDAAPTARPPAAPRNSP